MNIALIGATGFVGSAILTELLNKGHKVTAIARNTSKIAPQANLTAVEADIFEEDKLAKLLTGNDAVISAYNSGWTNPNIYNDFINGSDAITAAVKKSGIKRLLVVGGAGSLEVAPGVQLVDTPQFPEKWKQGALAAREALNTLKEENQLDWTFLSPAILLEPGQRTGVFRLGTDQPVFNEKEESKISVQDLAVAIVNEIEQPQFIRKRFTVGY